MPPVLYALHHPALLHNTKLVNRPKDRMRGTMSQRITEISSTKKQIVTVGATRPVRFTRIHRYESLASFALTMLIICLAFAISEVFPFGALAPLREDAIYQYSGFFGWFSEVLNGNASISYSNAKGLGGPTIGLFAYYLASPFNVLMAFCDPSDAPKAMSIIIILKLSTMSCASSLFLKKRIGLTGGSNIILASTYGLAACNFVSGSNLMWLDGMISLPLVCLAIHHLKMKGAIAPLSLLTGAAIIANWYSAYMVCIYSVFWTVLEICFDRKEHLLSKKSLAFFLQYCISMVLGACISAVLFLPTILDLLNTGSAPTMNSSQNLEILNTVSPVAILSKNYIGDMSIHPSSIMMTGGLFIFSILVIGFICFLFSSLPIRFKLPLLLVLILIVLSELSPLLSLIWTGFSKAESYNPRFHFTVIFTLMTGAGLFLKFGNRQHFIPILSGALYIGIMMLLIVCNGYNSHRAAALQMLMASLTSISLYFLTSGVRDKSKVKDIGSISYKLIEVLPRLGITLALIIEAAVPITLAFDISNPEPHLNVNHFKDYYDSISQLSSIGNIKGSFSRSEHLGISYLGKGSTTFPTGESLALDIKGVNHYSSTGTQASKELLGSLGYNGINGTRGITYYNSPLAIPDALLGISSIFASEDATAPYGTQVVGSEDSDYGDIVLHQYSRTADLGFVLPAARVDTSLGSKDPFQNQDSLSYALTGVGDVYTDIDIILSGDPRSESNVNLTIPVDTQGAIYFYVCSNKPLSLSCNGRYIQNVNEWEFSSNIIYLGTYNPGDNVTVKISTLDQSPIENISLTARQLTREKYEAIIRSFDQVCADTFEWSDKRIGVEAISHDGSSLVLTIPYDPSWEIKVNGISTSPIDWNGFLLIPLQEGKNLVDMTYHIRGLKEGVIISLLGIISTCALNVVTTKCKPRK